MARGKDTCGVLIPGWQGVKLRGQVDPFGDFEGVAQHRFFLVRLRKRASFQRLLKRVSIDFVFGGKLMFIFHRYGLVFPAFLFLASFADAAERYVIQIGAYETAAAAEAAALSAEAYADPVHVFEEGGTHPWKVTIGEFEFYAGAWAAKEKLNRPELTGCFIARRNIARPQRNEQLPVDQPFTPEGFPNRPRNRVPVEELEPLEYMRTVGLESGERLPAELSGSTRREG